MNTRAVFPRLTPALAMLALALCLFGDCMAIRSSHVLGPVITEASAIMLDVGTQWVLYVCAATYFATFFVLRLRRAGLRSTGTRLNPSLAAEIWLAGLVAVAVLAYAVYYPQAVKSTQALTLLGAAALGQGAALWAERTLKSKVQSPKSGRKTILASLVMLFMAAALWQAEGGHMFHYQGQGRWMGPWDNPNTFGVLMGVGLVLAVGKLVQSLKPKVQSQTSAECGVRTAECRTLNLWPWLQRLFFLAAATVMGVGLVNSYSRGAWVGTVVALAYLGYQIGKAERGMGRGKSRKRKAERRNWEGES
jgi:hypothetical protein